MKILFLIRSLEFGGSERQLVVIASGLAQRGHDVAVATLHEGGALEEELGACGVPLVSLRKRSRWDLIGLALRFRQLIKEQNPDVIYSFLPAQNLLALLARRFSHCRVVWAVRASNVDLRRYGWITAWTYRLEAWLSRMPDLVIANSYAGAAHALTRGFPAAKLHVVPNGIDCEEFSWSERERCELRRSWNVSDDEKLIGIVARLDPMKDHTTFLRAAARIVQSEPRARFLCVGEGQRDYLETLRAEAAQLGLAERLMWIPPRHHPAAIYSAVDLLVLSSAYGEGFPNVVGEAMACGVRCVVTNVGDAAAIVGMFGMVVPPSAPERLSRATLEMLRLPRTQAAARELHDHVVASFSTTRSIEETENLLAGQVD